MLKDIEQAQEVVKNYKAGQVNIYVDASVCNERAGIEIYTTLLQVHISKTVANSN
jgi:RNA:NAD 2'-phosphotransferase (TPT1/KptA family)